MPEILVGEHLLALKGQVLEAAHADMAETLMKPGADILASLTPEQADLWHAATGVAGEGGELLDAAKKYAVYQKPVDRANVIEELGDIEFYLQCVRKNLGITREETLQANMAKLEKRYPSGKYTNADAQARADKA